MTSANSDTGLGRGARAATWLVIIRERAVPFELRALTLGNARDGC